MEVRCYILISNISGSVKVAPLQILQFPVILPHKFQDAEKFNLQFSDFSEITETADKLRWLRYQKGLRQRDVADYSGCRDMNQVVISRMDLIYDMEAPDLNTMVKRVMKVTGFTDEQEATKMAIVVRDIAERCRQTMITDGSCGMREFKSWVLSTMVTNDPYESALSTIISSASADPDNRAELISACLEPQYSKTI